MKILVTLSILFSILFTTLVRADHGMESQVVWYSKPLVVVGIALAWLVLWCIFLIAKRKKFVAEEENTKDKLKLYSSKRKTLLFMIITLPIALVTIFIAAATIYENIHSVTGGPIHWHADYEVWVCGERLDLVDPKFPSNKIGTPLFHEHNDDRIHVEGTVNNLTDISLEHYFEVIGGDLSSGEISYLTNKGMVHYRQGNTCPNGDIGTLTVLVNGERIGKYQDYILYPDSYVPPGDCIIIEFGAESENTTDKVCESWSAKGWAYNSYERPTRNVGGKTWQ